MLGGDKGGEVGLLLTALLSDLPLLLLKTRVLLLVVVIVLVIIIVVVVAVAAILYATVT